MKGGLRTRYRASTEMRAKKYFQFRSASDGDSQNLGFTIVEVMIVLAVTGALFVSAAVLISGRTAKTQFEQSINQMTGQIRQQINDVASGYYPNRDNFACAKNAAGNGVAITAGTNAQGTNADCIFLGKALHFGATNADIQRYTIFPVAGLRTTSTGDEVTSIAAANPNVIYPAAPNTNAPNGTDTTPLQYGLKVSKMYYNGNQSLTTGVVAFLTSLGQYNGTELVSGSSQVSMLPILNTTIGEDTGTTAAKINSNIVSSANAFATPAQSVSICFDSGTTEQSGLVEIGGGNGRQLSVTLTIKGNKGC